MSPLSGMATVTHCRRLTEQFGPVLGKEAPYSSHVDYPACREHGNQGVTDRPVCRSLHIPIMPLHQHQHMSNVHIPPNEFCMFDPCKFLASMP